MRCLDPLNLHDLPEGLTSADFRPLWLGILELITEAQAIPQDAIVYSIVHAKCTPQQVVGI